MTTEIKDLPTRLQQAAIAQMAPKRLPCLMTPEHQACTQTPVSPAVCQPPVSWVACVKLHGQVRGGKNNMGVTRTGIHYPKAKWKLWRDEQLASVTAQWHGRPPIDATCRALIEYHAGDLKRRDVPAIEDAIFHVLERAGVVADDALIKDVDFRTTLDRSNPRACVTLEPMTMRVVEP